MRKKSHRPKPAPAILATRSLETIRGGDGTTKIRLPKSGDVTLKRG